MLRFRAESAYTTIWTWPSCGKSKHISSCAESGNFPEQVVLYFIYLIPKIKSLIILSLISFPAPPRVNTSNMPHTAQAHRQSLADGSVPSSHSRPSRFGW